MISAIRAREILADYCDSLAAIPYGNESLLMIGCQGTVRQYLPARDESAPSSR